jgi:hypothetical protein
VVRQFVAPLDETPRSVPCFPRPPAHHFREHRATVEVTANALGQIRTTPWTQIRAVTEKVRAKLVRSEALGACGTHPHCVLPAVPEEEGVFHGAKITWSSAIDMGHAIAAEVNGVSRRDHLPASRALWFSHLCTASENVIAQPDRSSSRGQTRDVDASVCPA